MCALASFCEIDKCASDWKQCLQSECVSKEEVKRLESEKAQLENNLTSLSEAYAALQNEFDSAKR